jgi:uncharacterized protein RhaS with RHS repeats
MYYTGTGQWMQEDPIGFDAGDPNLRRYVGNDPTNATDPTGLEKKEWKIANPKGTLILYKDPTAAEFPDKPAGVPSHSVLFQFKADNTADADRVTFLQYIYTTLQMATRGGPSTYQTGTKHTASGDSPLTTDINKPIWRVDADNTEMAKLGIPYYHESGGRGWRKKGEIAMVDTPAAAIGVVDDKIIEMKNNKRLDQVTWLKGVDHFRTFLLFDGRPVFDIGWEGKFEWNKGDPLPRTFPDKEGGFAVTYTLLGQTYGGPPHLKPYIDVLKNQKYRRFRGSPLVPQFDQDKQWLRE